jgi:hypothetical protein
MGEAKRGFMTGVPKLRERQEVEFPRFAKAARRAAPQLFFGGCFRRLVGDDLVFNFLVGGRGNDLLCDQIALGAIRAAINDLLSVLVADTG